MKVYTYFDIETTGLNPHTDVPIQFAYLQMQENGIFLMRNAFYIKTTSASWSEEAQAVHHITRDMLDKYGVEEVRAISTIYSLLKNADVVTYNGNNFDLPMVNNRIQQLGIVDLFTDRGFDVMLEWQKFHGGKRRKLLDLAQSLGYHEAYISAMVNRLYGVSGQFLPHDARYDVVETMLVHRRLLQEMEAAKPTPPKTAPAFDPSTIQHPEV